MDEELMRLHRRRHESPEAYAKLQAAVRRLPRPVDVVLEKIEKLTTKLAAARAEFTAVQASCPHLAWTSTISDVEDCIQCGKTEYY